MVSDDGRTQDPRLAVLSALVTVLADPGALVGLLASAEDDDDALQRLQEAYRFSTVQAQAVLDCQLRRVSRAHRTALEDELRAVRHASAVPWDPPLEISAVVRSAQLLEVVIAGEQHSVAGEDRNALLGALIALVRERLARPRRRRVAVRIHLADGPARILVDPVGGAQFQYDDPAAPA